MQHNQGPSPDLFAPVLRTDATTPAEPTPAWVTDAQACCPACRANIALLYPDVAPDVAVMS
jgi:hypothetical protein